MEASDLKSESEHRGLCATAVGGDDEQALPKVFQNILQRDSINVTQELKLESSKCERKNSQMLKFLFFWLLR